MSASYAIQCPRKVILFGEHSVLYGKLAIAAAVDNYEQIMVDVTSGVPSSFHVTDLVEEAFWNAEKLGSVCQEVGSAEKIDPQNPKPPSQDVIDLFWKIAGANADARSRLDLLKVTALYLWCQIVDSANQVGAVRCIIKPDPGWTGVGSSASYSVAMAAALLTITGQLNLPLTDEGRKLVSDWAFCCEHFFHGSPSGVDNTICAFGGMVRFRKDCQLELGRFPSDVRALIVMSAEPKSTKAMIERVAGFREEHPQVVDAIFDAMDSVAMRASSVIDALLERPEDPAQFKKLAELVDENQGLLQSLKVSTPKLDEICEISRQHGFSGKLTGAGGGGCVVILMDRNVSQDQVSALEADLEATNFSSHPVALGVPGLTIHLT